MGRMDPTKQFSKKLARWTAVFWFMYMTWLSVLMLLSPDVSLYAVYMAIISTVVMIINVYSYCKNSIAEKFLLTMLDKTRIELSLGNAKEKGDDDGTEGVSNG